jgi:hydroxyethylthiazole kinase-like uncharacterized protein yjeF
MPPTNPMPNLPQRPRDSHKGTYGTALIVAGSDRYTGAAVLATEAALRSGVGRVVVVATPVVCQAIRYRSPEAIVIEGDTQKGVLSGTSMADIGDLCTQYSVTAIGIGSGLGAVDAGLYTPIMAICERESLPIVVDADAIVPVYNHCVNRPLPPQRLVFTPHPGEYRRMVGLTHGAPTPADVACVARSINHIVVYKCHRSFVASDQGIWTASTGNQALATAGSGDVLMGMITGCIAQGMGTVDGAQWGVYLHGLAGDYAAKKWGLRSVLARDICDSISDAYAQVADH